MEEIKFKSKISRKEVITYFAILFFLGIALYFRSLNDKIELRWFAFFLILVVFVLFLSRIKIFILKENELIVRRQFFTSKFDKIYKKNQISKVLFTFIPGKFGGDAIIVYTIFINDFDTYIIYLNPDEINEFIKSMDEIGINVVNDLKK